MTQYDNTKALTENAMAGVDITEPNEPQYFVVGEWIERSEMVPLERATGLMDPKADSVLTCEGMASEYIAIVEDDGAGTRNIIADGFKTAEEAFKYLDEKILKKGIDK